MAFLYTTDMGIIEHKFDTDLYKLSMAQVFLSGGFGGIKFCDVRARYTFIDRRGTQFPTGFAAALVREIQELAALPPLTASDMAYCRKFTPFLSVPFLEWYSGHRYDPSEVVECRQREDGTLAVTVEGPIYRASLWELVLMPIISELYFKMSGLEPDADTQKRCIAKGRRMCKAGLTLVDFGSRRRFSKEIQRMVIENMIDCFRDGPGVFAGTSNVWFAEQFGIKSMGTHAHELFMMIAALFGYRIATRITLQSWQDQYRGKLGIALTDTFTSDVFFRDFDDFFARLFDGVRHDSGNPFEFTDKAIAHYKRLGIDPLSKTIVFSDALDDTSSIKVHEYCKGKIKCPGFGIGTFLTNDCGHQPLNMVIKLTAVQLGDSDWIPAVKLSDAPGKNTGDKREIEYCKGMLRID